MLALLVYGAACESEPLREPDGELPMIVAEATRPPSPPPPSAVLRSIDVHGPEHEGASGARIVLRFEGAPLFEQERLAPQGVLPARIGIELSRTALDASLAPLQAFGRAGVERVRLADLPPRVVIDLQPGARGRVFYLTDPYRIVVDVEASFAQPAHKSAPVVVLDPGHGGREPGAANARYDLVEATLALQIAKLAAHRLRARLPGARVLLTREDDSGLSLEARCALANAMEADVFVSIHLNASIDPVRRGGVTTFVLDTTEDRQALRLAARENGTRVSRVTGIQTLLAQHHRRGQAEGSLRLASELQRTTLASGREVVPALGDRGVRRAMFYVLVGARMPAVLLEASFLTHDPEARALATLHYRRALADGIASGIVAYLDSR